jgi:tetratricopeptide (TPR) repeat protein
VDLYMTRALALRVTGDLTGAIAALDRALQIDPYTFLALLSKGALLEQLGHSKAAAAVYENALKLAPTDPAPPLRAPLERARQAVKANADALRSHLTASVADLRARHAGGLPDAEGSLARFDEALAIFSGQAKPYPQQPLLLHYPRLPAIPFHPRSDFPWLATLEAATPVIQAELAGCWNRASAAISPTSPTRQAPP